VNRTTSVNRLIAGSIRPAARTLNPGLASRAGAAIDWIPGRPVDLRVDLVLIMGPFGVVEALDRRRRGGDRLPWGLWPSDARASP
jgi:hypothetical protein